MAVILLPEDRPSGTVPPSEAHLSLAQIRHPTLCLLHFRPGPASGQGHMVDQMAMVTRSPQFLSVSKLPVSSQWGHDQVPHDNRQRAGSAVAPSRKNSAGSGLETSRDFCVLIGGEWLGRCRPGKRHREGWGGGRVPAGSGLTLEGRGGEGRPSFSFFSSSFNSNGYD